jgi:ATP-binding cassette subfamily F protein 3
VGRGEIRPFDGDLDDYQQYLLEESRRLRDEARAASAALAEPAVSDTATAPARPALPSLLRPLQRELATIDQRLAVLQDEKASLEARLADQPTPAQIAEAGRRLKALEPQLTALEERWLELSAQIETLGAA